MQRLFKIHAEAAPWVGEISLHINASSGQRRTNSGDVLRRKLLLTAALYLSIACISLTARQQLSLPTQLSNAQHHLPTHDPHPGPPDRRWVNAPHLRDLGLQPWAQSSLTGNTVFVCQGVGDHPWNAALSTTGNVGGGGGALQRWDEPCLIAWLARTNTSHFGPAIATLPVPNWLLLWWQLLLEGGWGHLEQLLLLGSLQSHSLQSPIFSWPCDSRSSKWVTGFLHLIACHIFLPLLSSDLTTALEQQHSMLTTFLRKSCSTYHQSHL